MKTVRHVVLYRYEHTFKVLCEAEGESVMVYLSGIRPADGDRITQLSVTSSCSGVSAEYTCDISDRKKMEQVLEDYLKAVGLQLQRIKTESCKMYLTMQINGKDHMVYACFESIKNMEITRAHCVMDEKRVICSNRWAGVSIMSHRGMIATVRMYCSGRL